MEAMHSQLSHLFVLKGRLEREQARLDEAATPQEKEMRSVWVEQCKKEIKGEEEFLARRGIVVDIGHTYPQKFTDISDEELLAELDK